MLNAIDDAMNFIATVHAVAEDTIDTLLLLTEHSDWQEATIELVLTVCYFVYFAGQAFGRWWWGQDPIGNAKAFLPAVEAGKAEDTPKFVLATARVCGRFAAMVADGCCWMLGDGGAIVWDVQVVDRLLASSVSIR